MAFRFIQWIRREFVRPLVAHKSSFSTGKNEPGPTESLLVGNEPKLTKKEKRLKMFLQGIGVFLPSVFLGHVLSNHDIFGPSVKDKRRAKIAEEERKKALEQEKKEETEEDDGQSENEKEASDKEEKSKASKDNEEQAEHDKGTNDSKESEKAGKNDKENKKEAKDSNAGENDAK